MVPRYPGKSSEGEAVCKSVGLNYGLWTKEETVSAVFNYLKNKEITDAVWIGAFQTAPTKTTGNGSCDAITNENAHNYTKWVSANSTNLPTFMFPSQHTVEFHGCKGTNVFAKLDDNRERLIYYHDGDVDKKFLCVKEAGEFTRLVSL